MIASDSTTLIILLDLDRFNFLSKLFSKVYIPQAVYDEITYKNNFILPAFMEVVQVQKNELLEELLLLLDQGESEAIVLAKQRQLPLIIDEKKGRKIATNLNIEIIGLLGIIFLNIKKGNIQKKEADQFLQKALKHGYRISQKLIQEMISQI
jgi:uncharacterized protein